MKRSFRALGVLALASGLALTGCKKDIETSDLSLDLTKKATVTAYFFAETDNQTQGLEFAQEGTKVIVSILNSEFNPTATGNWTDTATIAAGKITVEIPATTQGVTVNFYPAEFTAEQTQPYGSNVAKISKIFKLAAGSSLAGVKAGEVRTHQVTYDAGVAFDNYTEKVTMKLQLKAVFKVGDLSTFVYGTKVINVYCLVDGQEWSTTATVADKGIITISVPKSQEIKLRFENSKDLNTTPASSKTYRYTYTFTSSSESNPNINVAEFGDGEPWGE